MLRPGSSLEPVKKKRKTLSLLAEIHAVTMKNKKLITLIPTTVGSEPYSFLRFA